MSERNKREKQLPRNRQIRVQRDQEFPRRSQRQRLQRLNALQRGVAQVIERGLHQMNSNEDTPEGAADNETSTLTYLVKMLECPVCQDSFSAPIFHCENGHGVCMGCRQRLRCCPVCRGQLLGRRSYALEDIADKFVGRRCKNYSAGCTLRLPPGTDLTKHQYNCEYRSCVCLYCTDQGVPRNMLVSHSKDIHGQVVKVGPSVAFQISLDQVPFKAELIEFRKEFFWYWRLIKEGAIYFGISFCGKSDVEFYFSMKVKGRKKEAEIVHKGKVHSYEQHMSLPFLFPCENCVSMCKEFCNRDEYIYITLSTKPWMKT